VHIFPREILASRAVLSDIAAALPNLADRPALIVWADRDIAFRTAERRRWEATFPDHHTVILDGAGHYLQEDAAADVVAAIRNWQS
jgi:haloalkane dehalogenase